MVSARTPCRSLTFHKIPYDLYSLVFYLFNIPCLLFWHLSLVVFPFGVLVNYCVLVDWKLLLFSFQSFAQFWTIQIKLGTYFLTHTHTVASVFKSINSLFVDPLWMWGNYFQFSLLLFCTRIGKPDDLTVENHTIANHLFFLSGVIFTDVGR